MTTRLTPVGGSHRKTNAGSRQFYINATNIYEIFLIPWDVMQKFQIWEIERTQSALDLCCYSVLNYGQIHRHIEINRKSNEWEEAAWHFPDNDEVSIPRIQSSF